MDNLSSKDLKKNWGSGRPKWGHPWYSPGGARLGVWGGTKKGKKKGSKTKKVKKKKWRNRGNLRLSAPKQDPGKGGREPQIVETQRRPGLEE